MLPTVYGENQWKREQQILKLVAVQCAVFLQISIMQFMSVNGIFVFVFGLPIETSDALQSLSVCVVQSINPFIYLVMLSYVKYCSVPLIKTRVTRYRYRDTVSLIWVKVSVSICKSRDRARAIGQSVSVKTRKNRNRKKTDECGIWFGWSVGFG